jgi:hypothetical protein
MPLSHYIPIAAETVCPFVVLAVAGVSLADDVVASGETEERAASVDASLPHLEDNSIHDLGLQQGEAIISFHVVNGSCLEDVFLFHEVGDHSWLVKFP